jgi:hypothetical protein
LRRGTFIVISYKLLMIKFMTHYVCTGGCGGVSDTPGTCQAESCSLYGEPLKECNCTDGQHEEVLQQENQD